MTSKPIILNAETTQSLLHCASATWCDLSAQMHLLASSLLRNPVAIPARMQRGLMAQHYIHILQDALGAYIVAPK